MLKNNRRQMSLEEQWQSNRVKKENVLDRIDELVDWKPVERCLLTEVVVVDDPLLVLRVVGISNVEEDGKAPTPRPLDGKPQPMKKDERDERRVRGDGIATSGYNNF